MNKNYNIIFSKTECPSSDIILKYIKRELTSEEQHGVETHLTDCQICSDELEGFLLLKNKDKLNKTVAALNLKIENRIKKSVTPHRMRIKKFYAIAASIILLIGSTFIISQFFNKSYENLAENEVSKTKQINEEENSIKSTYKSEKSEEVIKEVNTPTANKNNQTKKENVKQDLISNNSISKGKNFDMDNNEDEELNTTSIDTNLYKNADISIEISMADVDDVINDTEKNKQEKDKLDNVSGNNVFAASERSSVSLFKKNKNNKSAAAGVETNNYPAEKQVENSTDIYNKGYNLFQNKKYSEAIPLFDSVLTINQQYTAEAEWHKALSLIHLNKNEQAKVILKKIIETNGKFATQANEKLKEIEKN